jgi:hypothetical protein
MGVRYVLAVSLVLAVVAMVAMVAVYWGAIG